MLRVEQLNKQYSSGILRKHRIEAVKNVSFHIPQGQTLGLAGNSGCGKSTVAQLVAQLIHPESGKVFLDNQELTGLSPGQLKKQRTKLQIIFQHPESSLDPRKKIITSLLEPMVIHKMGKNQEERMEKIEELFELVGLNNTLFNRYPHQISGGEAQRIIIARAMTLDPLV